MVGEWLKLAGLTVWFAYIHKDKSHGYDGPVSNQRDNDLSHEANAFVLV